MKALLTVLGVIAVVYIGSMLTRSEKRRVIDPDGLGLLLGIAVFMGVPALILFLLSLLFRAC